MSAITLYHGSDLASANDILNHGLDASKARRYNGSGEFWSTTDQFAAEVFARVNPAAGAPACLVYEVDEDDLRMLLAQKPVVAEFYAPDAYQFFPSCFDFLNRTMIQKRVHSIP
jgi:hypothetical protein